jgi:hypothetical protein
MVTVQYIVPCYIPKTKPVKKDDGSNPSQTSQNTDASKKGNIWNTSDKESDNTTLTNIGGEKMPDNLNNLGTWGKGTTLDQAEWHAARVGEVNDHSSGDWGSAYVKGSTDFLKAQGRVYGDTGYKDGTVTASGGVQGRFELVGAHYQAGYNSPSMGTLGGHDMTARTTANADAYVGAQGNVEGGISLGKNDYAHVGGSAFAGASGTLQGSESLGDVASVNGSVSGYAGVGIKGDLDAGYKDGNLEFKFGFGAAWGLGYSFDFGFSVNIGAVGDCVEDVAKSVGNGVEDVAKDIGNAIEGLF